MDAVTLPALRHAIESRDGTALAGFYDDEATLQIIDALNPPSHPKQVRGGAAISAYFADICGRTMTHRVENGIMDGNRAAFTQTCTYPDGKQVYCAATLDLAGGKIARQVSIQVWDS